MNPSQFKNNVLSRCIVISSILATFFVISGFYSNLVSAETMSSSLYRIQSDSINFGGGQST
ncbi:MAG: hypothetical protein M3Q80_01345, partial [bacterium]|nr:hypothetical protein [bacterium]